jgi:hypothetical protein
MTPAVGGTPKVNAAAVVVDAPTGVVRYDWAGRRHRHCPAATSRSGRSPGPGKLKQTFPTLTYHTVDVLADLDNA